MKVTSSVLGFSVAILFVVAACGSGDPPIDSEGGADAPVAENVSPTAGAPTESPATEPTDTPDADVRFVEAFDGALAPGWTWSAATENEPDGGWLELSADPASGTRLVREVSDAPFELTTGVRVRPTSNFQVAGLIVASRSTPDTDFAMLGRGYCSQLDVPDFCRDDAVYFDSLVAGEMTGSFVLDLEPNTDVLYLRLVVDGGLADGLVSDDGTTWTPVGQLELPPGALEIGLVVDRAVEEPISARFDFVAVAEPSGGAAIDAALRTPPSSPPSAAPTSTPRPPAPTPTSTPRPPAPTPTSTPRPPAPTPTPTPTPRPPTPTAPPPTPAATTAPPPTAPPSVRPPTGVVLSVAGPRGMGQLTVQNGTATDGVVIVAHQNGAPVTAAYVRATETALLTGIPDGTYILFFAKGERWDPVAREFTQSVTYQRFDDLFPFSTTATSSTAWTVTLHGVASGNAGAYTVPPGSFPDI